MTVYVDVLIAVNIFINFILLLLTAKLNLQSYTSFRIILGAVFGGACSLIILLPISNILVNILLKLLIAAIMTIISFGYNKSKIFTRNVFTLFSTTYIFAGIMLSVWYVFKPQKILINNSTVYFDVSVTFLIFSTTAIYLLITVVRSLVKKEAISAKICNILLHIEEKSLKLNAIIDTGNSLEDLFSGSETITVCEKELIKMCDGQKIIEKYPKRYRIFPCKTVAGDTILEGLRCDKMEIEMEGKKYTFKNPIAVISKSNFTDDFNAILNSNIIMKMR